MTSLLRISSLIDGLNRRIGSTLKWLILVIVLLSAGNAIARRVFHLGSTAFLEMQWYLFSGVFLLGAGYAFLKNAHVRIDFVSGRLSAQNRSRIDVIGILLFLMPFCWLLLQLSWPLFLRAWQSGEMSQNAGGLIRWPVYLLIPLGAVLLLLQSVSELIKRCAFLRGLHPDPLTHRQEGQDSSGNTGAACPSPEAP